MLLYGPVPTAKPETIVVGSTYLYAFKLRSKATGLTLPLIGVVTAARLDIRNSDAPSAALIAAFRLGDGITLGTDILGEDYLQIRIEAAQTATFQGKGRNRRAVGRLELADNLSPANISQPVRFVYCLDYGDPVG